MNPLILLAVAVHLQTPAPATRPVSTAATIAQGRELTALFYAGEDAKLWPRFSDRMKQALGSVESLAAVRAQVTEQAGVEQSVQEEKVEPLGAMQAYLRIARFSKAPEPVMVQWALGERGVIEGFFIRPVPKEAASERLDYQTKTPLRLPFDGQWFVFWGGRSVAQNYHASAGDLRFAADFLIQRQGSTHRGEGKRNEDFYCFGQKIFAPAAGTVAATQNDVDDNAPGALNPQLPMGNHVILDHGNGEFSFMAHFKKGSVVVKKGDQVKAGDMLGLAGNSGMSTEPHLHYHLQDTSDFGRGRGLPAAFLNYAADGQPVSRGEPVKGQRIEKR